MCFVLFVDDDDDDLNDEDADTDNDSNDSDKEDSMVVVCCDGGGGGGRHYCGGRGCPTCRGDGYDTIHVSLGMIWWRWQWWLLSESGNMCPKSLDGSTG